MHNFICFGLALKENRCYSRISHTLTRELSYMENSVTYCVPTVQLFQEGRDVLMRMNGMSSEYCTMSVSSWAA